MEVRGLRFKYGTREKGLPERAARRDYVPPKGLLVCNTLLILNTFHGILNFLQHTAQQ